MALEHLCIVDTAIAGVIESLAGGHAVNQVVSTAAVKPGETTDGSTIDRFEAVTRDYLARVEGLPDSRSKVTLKHPWFGELNVSDWHRLAALHHRVHRKQIERIVRLLPPKQRPV